MNLASTLARANALAASIAAPLQSPLLFQQEYRVPLLPPARSGLPAAVKAA